MVARVTVGGGEEFPVVGIGGVIVTHRMRGRGLARMVLEADPWGSPPGSARIAPMLFCREELAPFYGEFGFEPITGPVAAEQPGGPIVVPLGGMWSPLRAGAGWPDGAVAVLGEPLKTRAADGAKSAAADGARTG